MNSPLLHCANCGSELPSQESICPRCDRELSYRKPVKPSLYERIHWAIFNLFAMLFAALLILVSLVFTLTVIATIMGKPIGHDEYSGWMLLLFIPMFVGGILMLKAKPYYPSKYKDWYESRKITNPIMFWKF